MTQLYRSHQCTEHYPESTSEAKQHNMAPSFDNLDPETDYDDGEEEIDYSGNKPSPAKRGTSTDTDNAQTSENNTKSAWKKV